MSETRPREEGLELLVNCRNELEAQEIRGALEAAGMPAFVFDKGGLGLNMADEVARYGGLQVQVPVGRREEAIALLDSIRSEADAIDWDAVDVGAMPPEVEEVVASRGASHAFRRFIGILGPVLGIAILLAAAVGILVIILD